MEITVRDSRRLHASGISPVLDGEAQRARVINAEDVAGGPRAHESTLLDQNAGGAGEGINANPFIYREGAGPKIQIGVIGDDIAVAAIELHALRNLRRDELRRPETPARVITIPNIMGVTIAWPPTDHSSRWRRAGWCRCR